MYFLNKKLCYLLVSSVSSVLLLILPNSSALADSLNQRQYAEMFTLYNMRSPYGKDVNACLKTWGNEHPFKNKGRLQFRVIDNNVKVFGMGENVRDDTATTYPQMILIRPAVNVMGKMEYYLTNPNGWYCMDSNVTVMGKSVINLACSAKLTSTHGSITVLGKSDSKEKSGTTVMGKTVINRHCGDSK